MVQNVSWYVEDHILYVTYSGIMTDADFEAMVQTALPMLDALPADAHKVHAIGDMSAVTELRTSARALQILTPLLKHPRTGWYVAFGYDQRILDFFLNIASRMFGSPYRKVYSKAEALQFLADMHPELADAIAKDLGNAASR